MTSETTDTFLRNAWYFAMPSAELGTGIEARTLLGEPVMFARDSAGKAYALRDICPHRGIPLSDGRLKGAGDEVECCYHGWRFRPDGVCSCIPSLVPDQDMDVSRIRVRAYPLHEDQGCLWIWMPAENSDGVPTVDPPRLPEAATVPKLVETMDFPCHVDHAVIGLMDPAHGPFVHQSWWWRSEASIHEKAKTFGPSLLGFSMLRHTPSSNSAGYKILGGNPTTEISFRLPGIRVEDIDTDRHAVVGLTAVTPISERQTRIYHMIYWTMPFLSVLKPLLRPFARRFLGQDQDIVVKQQRGLAHNPSLMLINDSDVQAKWYFRLKKAWATSVADKTPFENPVKETTLRWRS